MRHGHRERCACGTGLARCLVMHSKHAAVWLDHHEAKVFFVDAETAEIATVEAPHRHVARRSTATADRTHPAEAQHYYHDVARALEGVEAILVCGPSTAKLEFIKYVHKHNHEMEPKIIGVETADHPTEGQLTAYARKYFLAADRMQ